MLVMFFDPSPARKVTSPASWHTPPPGPWQMVATVTLIFQHASKQSNKVDCQLWDASIFFHLATLSLLNAEARYCLVT